MGTQHDVIIVGTNPAGMAAFRALEGASAKVLLIDTDSGETQTDTDYSIVGALSDVAATFHARNDFHQRGIYGARELILDPRSLMGYLRNAVARAARARPTLVPGFAKRGKTRILDAHTVRVGRHVHRAAKVIFAPTFSYRRPQVPSEWGVRVLHGAQLLELDELPLSAAVSGMTALNLSLTLALSRLGVDVVGFERGDRFAELSHLELRRHALDSLHETVWTGEEFAFGRTRDGRATIRRGENRITPDVIISMERNPNYSPIAFDDPKAVAARLDYNTTRVGESDLFIALPHRGMPLSTENLEQAGRVAAHNVLVENPRWHARQLRLVRTLSSPEIACLGWIPSDGSVSASRHEMRIEDRAEGFFGRLYVSTTGDLVGAECLSFSSREYASLLAMAVKHRMPAQAFLETARLLGNRALSETTHHASSALGK